MKKLSRFFLVCFIVILTTVAFSKAIEITFWTFFGGGEAYIMTNLINQFNKEQDEILIREEPMAWGDYYNKLLAALVAGNPPDLAMMHRSSLTDFVERDAVIPLDDYLSSKIKDDYLENIRSAVTYNNKMYALPLDTHPIILFYNKNVLKEAGLVDENGKEVLPKTFEEFYAFCQQVKNRTGKQALVIEEYWNLGERLWLTIYKNLGGRLEDENGNFIIERDIAIKTYSEILKFFEEGLSEFVGYETGRALFITDEAAFDIDGVWTIAAFEEMGVLNNLGAVSIPSYSFTSQPSVWGDSHTLVIPKAPKINEERVKAAVTFAEWLVSHSYEWAKAGHLPVVKSVRTSEEFLDLPLRKGYMDAAEQAFIPQVMGWNEIKTKLADVGQGVILNQLTPEQAADEVLNTIKQVVK